MLFSDFPYGRNLDVDRGRKSMAKDLFDVVSLSQSPLDSREIIEAAHEDVTRKTAYMGAGFELDKLVESARARLRFFAPAREGSADLIRRMWQDASKVRGAIHGNFQDIDIRIAAGCCHHALGGILGGSLDWEDTWLPYQKRTTRHAWVGIEPIQCHEEVDGSLEGIMGLREAWANPAPS